MKNTAPKAPSKERRLANALRRDREVLARLIARTQSRASKAAARQVDEWMESIQQLESELGGLNPRHPLLRKPVPVRAEVRRYERKRSR